MLITTEMLFENNVQEIVSKIESDYKKEIQLDFDMCPNDFPDLFSWLELHTEIVGSYFIKHLINYGFTNESIQK